MNHIEDRLLVNGFLLSRSEMLFRQLYRKHTLSIYRLSLQLTNKDIPATEDIVQETWVRAIQGLRGLRWDAAFRTWLSGIAINCCREYLRKKNIATMSYSDCVQEQAIYPSSHHLDLQNALALLPLGYREILLLHDVQGFKHHEIGELLGINEGTSKSQLFNARKAMRKLLN